MGHCRLLRHLASVLPVALVCLGAAAQAQGIPVCEDGLDNDGDGLIDFPADPGCVAPDGTSEQNTVLDGGPFGDAGGGGDAGGLGDAGGVPQGDGGNLPDAGNGNGTGGGVSTGAQGSGFGSGGATRPQPSSCAFTLGPIEGGVTAFLVLGLVFLIALWRRAHGRSGRSD
jgi:hypothetical protein